MNFFLRRLTGLVCFGTGLLVLLAFVPPALAQNIPPVIVRILPPESQLALEQTIDIAVEVQDVVDLYGIDLLLEFDPQALEVIDMDADLDGVQVQLGTLLDPGFVIVNIADNQAGRLRFAMTQLNPSTPKSGTGSLMVVRFKGIALKDDTALSLLSVKLATPFGTYVTWDEIENSLLSVVAEVSGPTSTPVEAQPAGTSMPTPTQTNVPANAPTSAAGNTGALPTATNALLYIAPTSTLALPAIPSNTPLATQISQALPTATSQPSLAQESSPTPQPNLVKITAMSDQATAVEPAAQAMVATATPDTPERRVFSGGENPGANTSLEDESAFPWWLIALLLGGGMAGGVVLWLRKRNPNEDQT